MPPVLCFSSVFPTHRQKNKQKWMTVIVNSEQADSRLNTFEADET